MKKIRTLLFCVFTFVSVQLFSQNYPWNSPLMICTSSDGINFNPPAVFQDSSGVPSVLNLGGDTLIAAFQWFPMPMNNAAHWDKIAVKFSYDGGVSWTAPTTCVFSNLPSGYQRPFDPALVQLPDGTIRMFFSFGINNPPAAGIDTWSAVSSDGINYTLDSNARYDSPLYHAIDPTVTFFNGTWYYNAWTSVQTDGAHRAYSSDGLNFITTTMSPYDGAHLWLGNYMTDGSTERFYGCGSGIWMASTTDMISWSTYTSIPVMGADPAVAKNSSGTYIMIYTGPPNLASVASFNSTENSVSVYPNPAKDFLNIHFTGNNSAAEISRRIEFYEASGKLVKTEFRETNDAVIPITDLASGIYFYSVFENEKLAGRGKLAVE